MEKIMDLMYFGCEDDSRQLEIDFKKEIKEKFDNVELRNAYDNIKGHRQEVYLDEEQKDDYYTWLIGKGWFRMSLNMQLMMIDKANHDEFKRIFELTKKQYLEAFKK
jgi:hypothetical protein